MLMPISVPFRRLAPCDRPAPRRKPPRRGSRTRNPRPPVGRRAVAPACWELEWRLRWPLRPHRPRPPFLGNHAGRSPDPSCLPPCLWAFLACAKMRLFRLQRQGSSMPGLAHRHRCVLPDIDALRVGCTQGHDRDRRNTPYEYRIAGMGFSHRTTLKLIGNEIKTMADAKSSRGMIAVDKMGTKVLFLNPVTYETEVVLDDFPC